MVAANVYGTKKSAIPPYLKNLGMFGNHYTVHYIKKVKATIKTEH